MPKKGKKGTEQRVKGNVKTASSGRMSELLGSEAVRFIGFDSVSGGLGGSNQAEGIDGGGRIEDLLAAGSGSSFHVAMKQLGKRDPTTKLKALQEFSLLCRREETQNILAVLHVWALMYNKLSTDNDHRVREASHKALRACAEKLKSSLAPQLRSIIGCWVSGMCDPHGPAASAAKLAFDGAFTSKKQREVLEFGSRAVVKHAEDLILNETPDTFSDPKVVPADERQQRYERALMMGVAGLALLLRQVSPDHLTTSMEVYQTLLSEKRLWKLARHKNPSVRASVFMLVTALCERTPEFVADNMKPLCSAVLGSLGEDDPVVIGPLWEACLTLVTKTENWSDHVNLQKGLLPGLWSFLKSGGHGSAKITYPCLLPLLSVLTDKVFSDDADFAILFLERLGAGLHGDRVRMSRVDSEVVMRTYRECVMYLMTRFKPVQSLCPVFSQMKDLFLYSLSKSCSLVQSEVVSSSLVHLLSSLLGTMEQNHTHLGTGYQNHPLLSCLESLRVDLEETLTSYITETTIDQKPLFTRLEELLSSFHSPPKPKKAKGGSVRFSDQPPDNTNDTTDGQDTEDHTSSPIKLPDNHMTIPTSHMTTDEGTLLRDYVAPVVCSLCAGCVVRLSAVMDLEMSGLLLKLLRLYCVDSAFSIDVLGVLKSNHPGLLSEYLEGSSPPDTVAIPTLLLKLTRLDALSPQSSLFSANMLECLLIMVSRGTDDMVTSPSWSLLTELVQENATITPLLLMKLEELGESGAAASLLGSCEHLLTGLLTGTPNNTIFLWPFLESLFTKQPDTPLSSKMFSTLCQQLCDAVSNDQQFSDSGVNMLRVLCKMQRSTVQVKVQDCTKLLEALLRWALFNPALEEPSLLECVIQCYHHLLSFLPDTTPYLASCSSLVTMAIASDQEKLSTRELLSRHLQSALVYSALHSQVMSHDTFNILYGSFTKLPKRIEKSLLPVSSLDCFCGGDLIFSPLFMDLPSTSLTPTLSSSLTPLLYPALLLNNRLLAPAGDQSDPELVKLVSLQQRLECGCGLEEACEGGSRDWVELVLSLSLAAACLTVSHLVKRSLLESRVGEMFHGAVEGCVQYASDHAPHSLSLLVAEVVERASISGSLWLPIVNKIFSILGKVFEVNQDISIQDLMSALYKEPEGPIIFSALRPLKTDCYQQQVEELATQRQSDPCLLAGCLKLLPSNEVLLSLGSKIVTEIAEKQSNSELNLLENLSESSGDPLSYSTLKLFNLLLAQGKEPPSVSMDFVLCSSVSLIELLNEAPPRSSSSVNGALFTCQLLDTVHQLCLHLTSPQASGKQAKEWREFFQPSLQSQLLPLFLRQSGCSVDPCLAYQSLSLSRVVWAVCSSPEGVELGQLTGILLAGPTHPQQLAAFKLAERLMDSHTVVLDEDTETDETGNPLKLSQLKDLFSGCFERVDMDLVFFEDSQQDQRSEVTSKHTVAYLLTWLLVIRAMSRCGPESRGALSEWLKELSLFDHLLHGLLSLLPSAQRRSGFNLDLEVTLTPNLQQLALMTYTAVARQLPCMLRQWYLTLNRQTSAQIAAFTTKHVSPHLQNTELASIREAPPIHGNMEVRAYSSVSEVSVVYRVDEFSIELFLRLPESYPLQPPVLREGKRVRVDQAHWRKWLLQLNIFVTNQNGSLLDGLLLWKSNLDKHFSGVEDCMICFSVIHSSNYSLPKMNCKTCKKKFHSACLYKWFNTSNKSSCPMCRNIF